MFFEGSPDFWLVLGITKQFSGPKSHGHIKDPIEKFKLLKLDTFKK